MFVVCMGKQSDSVFGHCDLTRPRSLLTRGSGHIALYRFRFVFVSFRHRLSVTFSYDYCTGTLTPSYSLRFDYPLKSESPEYSISTNQEREQTMDCPLTNHGPYTFTSRIGAKRQENPANQISVDLSVDQSHKGLQRDA